MKFFAGRRARLRPEYASLYPRVAPGIWLGARRVAGRARRYSREARLREQLGLRILPDAHFEFQGGQPRQSVEARTRRADSLSQPPPSTRNKLARALRQFVTKHLVAADPYERARDSEAQRRRSETTRRPDSW